MARAFRAAAVRGCLSCRNTASRGRNSPSWDVTASSNRRLCSALGRWPQILTTASPSARENCSEVSGLIRWAIASIASSSVETESSTHEAGRRFHHSHLANQRNIAAVLIGRVLPAILVVIGHALLRQRFHLLELAGELRLLQREDAHQLVAARIVHLVELVAGAELGGDPGPQHFHDLDSVLVGGVVG